MKLGADDYLFKPFLEEEVKIKLRNLFSKIDYNEKYKSFNNKEVIFSEGKTQLIILNKIVELTSVEYQMINLLIENHNKVISRDQFLDALYSYESNVFDRVIDVHIRNIRKKIKDVYDKELIKTIYRLGYSWIGVKDE